MENSFVKMEERCDCATCKVYEKFKYCHLGHSPSIQRSITWPVISEERDEDCSDDPECLDEEDEECLDEDMQSSEEEEEEYFVPDEDIHDDWYQQLKRQRQLE